MQPTAELMAREGVSLREAAGRLRVQMTNEECATQFRTKIFQRLLRVERLRFAVEVANDPGWSRRAAIGKMLYLVDRLIENGENDKALEGLLKVARVEGWLAAETSLNLTMGITDRELMEIKEKIAKRINGEAPSAVVGPVA